MHHILGEAYRSPMQIHPVCCLQVRVKAVIACTIEMSPYRTSIDWQESVLVSFERGYITLDLPAPLASNQPGRVSSSGIQAMEKHLKPLFPNSHGYTRCGSRP